MCMEACVHPVNAFCPLPKVVKCDGMSGASSPVFELTGVCVGILSIVLLHPCQTAIVEREGWRNG